jgi:mycofactocin precursor
MTDPQSLSEAQPEAPTTESDLAETALVEEVSIDGMCGVY